MSLATEVQVAEGAIGPAAEGESSALSAEFIRLAARHLDGAFFTVSIEVPAAMPTPSASS